MIRRQRGRSQPGGIKLDLNLLKAHFTHDVAMGGPRAIEEHRGSGDLPLAVLRDILIAAHDVQGDQWPVVGMLCDHGSAWIEHPAHAGAPKAKQHRHFVQRGGWYRPEMAALV
jgi:hypothetical protein